MDIVILTGAGISAESGLATFRSDTGLWNNFSIEDVATYNGFKRNPDLVMDFYNNRRKDVSGAEPNEAHRAIARLQQSKHNVFLITQNVDDLHERAGSNQVCHMHGSLAKARCEECDEVYIANPIMSTADCCPECGCTRTRPDIVWFGEVPMFMDIIDGKLRRCDVFLSIGTSGNVYPAAGFARVARKKGNTIEFNIDRSENANDFRERIIGPASETVPRWIDNLLENHDI